MNTGHHNLMASIAKRAKLMDQGAFTHPTHNVDYIQFRFDLQGVHGDMEIVEIAKTFVIGTDDHGEQLARHGLYNNLVKMYG